jgi:hypothetical protein
MKSLLLIVFILFVAVQSWAYDDSFTIIDSDGNLQYVYIDHDRHGTTATIMSSDGNHKMYYIDRNRDDTEIIDMESGRMQWIHRDRPRRESKRDNLFWQPPEFKWGLGDDNR